MIRHLKSTLTIGFALLTLLGCQSARHIAITVVEPAPVTLATTIKRIGVVNMHQPDNTVQIKKGMELLVARDDDFLNEKGKVAAIDGLFISLNQDPRFDTIVRLQGESPVIQNKEGGPDEASWEAIRKLCESYELDAIFALAFYHTDTEITLKKSRLHQRDLMRLEVANRGHELTLETLIENGWRIYDPFQKLVLDEFVFTEQVTARAEGHSPQDAYQAIGSRRDSLVFKSRVSGDAYGSRLRPYEKTIYRSYHTVGTDNFLAAQIRIENEDWETAIALWKKELSNEKAKIRAMACHNLAVVYESFDNLEEALAWAIKSDEIQSTKSSRGYIEELKNRMSQNLVVNAQLIQLGR